MKYAVKIGTALALAQYVVLSGVVSGLTAFTAAKTDASQPPLRAPTPTPSSVRAPSVRVHPTDVPHEPTPLPPPDTRCIIAVHGSRYDVTRFRSIHSGGNIFTCGTDMTAAFDSQHSPDILRKMSKYVVL